MSFRHHHDLGSNEEQTTILRRELTGRTLDSGNLDIGDFVSIEELLRYF